MLSKRKLAHQAEIFNGLGDQLNQKHGLYILSDKINWSMFDKEFEQLYCSDNGRPAKPIRLMVGLILLKHIRNLSDESIVEQWSENMYYQYFTGEFKINSCAPCSSTELVVFRQKIGEQGMELILKESIRINNDVTPIDKNNLILSIDTTVQEKNITYPTDDKQYKKIIKSCWKIASTHAIKLRRTHKKEYKQLSAQQRFKNSTKLRKQARKANSRIRTIAGILVRELVRKLPLEVLGKHLEKLKLYYNVISQKREDKNKIYSLHEQDVKCYTKGKAHKKFEFGSKCSIAMDQETGIIISAYNFTQTCHDSKTIPDVIDQTERLLGYLPKEAFVDRGYRGIKSYKDCAINIPKPDKNISKEKRKRHSNRAGIEPIIGHLKQHFRMGRNFYKGIFGDNINVILAAAAMNFKRVMNLWKKEAKLIWQLIYIYTLEIYWKNYVQKLKLTF
jgi:IS5 family transposase